MFQNYTGFDHPKKAPVVKGKSEGKGKEGDKNEDENGDMLGMPMEASPIYAAQIIWTWFHIQSDHWESLSILSKHATITTASMQINLIAVKAPELHPSFCKIGGWEPMANSVIVEHAQTLREKKIAGDAVVQHLKE